MIPRTWRGRASGIQQTLAVRVIHPGPAPLVRSPTGQMVRLCEGDDGSWPGAQVFGLRALTTLERGDVLLVAQSGEVELLFRSSWRHNFLLVTRRCDSRCVMCSQPPVDMDDAARVDALKEALRLIPDGAGDIGLTGGEPALLGERLVDLVGDLRNLLPSRPVHVLSNGRRFKELALASALRALAHPDLMVGVPLYADHAALHDEVVRAPGAFVETMYGYENLGRAGVPVEVRVVLQAMTLPRLEKLALFIYRNLPFASQIVFMGLEPTGWAVPNLKRLWIDPFDLGEPLERAVDVLRLRGMRVRIYNLPLCSLPRSLWSLATASISDWKNDFVPECAPCVVRDRCAGFFTSTVGKAGALIRVAPIMED